MKGLILKDLFMIKNNLRTIVLFFVVFTFISFKDNSNLSFMPAFISIMMFMTTFSYDDFNNWNAYAITFPNGRKNIVRSKYLASLLLAFIAIVITLGASFLMGYINHSLDIDKILNGVIGSVAAISILLTVLYPLIFKYGIEKGRIVLFVLVAFITAIIGIVLKNINISTSIIKIFNNYGIIIIPILLILFLFLSYKISERIYLKKEF